MSKAISPDAELMQLTSTVSLVRAIECAVVLGLSDAVPTSAEAAITSSALAKQLQLQPAPVYRLLRALAANGYFVEYGDRRFSHNDKSLPLRSDHPHSLRPMFLLSGHPATHRAWDALSAAVRDGKGAFEHAHGVPLFPYLGQHADMAEVFNNAMVAHTRPMVQALLASDAALGRTHKLCDVGGGLGQLLAALLKGNPKLTGAVFDLPTLEGPARDYLVTAGLNDRANFVNGSFLEAIPSGYDTYIIKNCLWNWGDADTVRILKNIHQALGADGRLLIVEMLITPETAPVSTLMDLTMLVLPNGRARTRDEYVDLADKAGLKLGASAALAAGHSFLEFHRG